MSSDFNLTKLERVLLVNQLRILEALYPDEASDLSVQREVLEYGYEMLYEWYTDHICEGSSVMTVEESLEVWDTMDMFDAINRSLPEGFNTEEYSVIQFRGYSGNNEGKFMSFARFTVERLKRFEYIPMQEVDRWNSHFPMRPAYRRMLNEWKKVPESNRFNMSVDELKIVLDAAADPDSN